ncbi:MAG: hypothetical protein PHC38_08655, partial [Weeksellaceae bacterium]|nr:hypothetical protein [Weeksellaceae bacterium]
MAIFSARTIISNAIKRRQEKKKQKTTSVGPTSPAPKPSSKTSTPSKPTYDTKTQTFTDSSGNKMSMSLSNALKSGATISSSSSVGPTSPAPKPSSKTSTPSGGLTSVERASASAPWKSSGGSSSSFKPSSKTFQLTPEQSQEIQFQEAQQSATGFIFGGGTMQDYGKKTSSIQSERIPMPGEIYERQVGIYEPTRTLWKGSTPYSTNLQTGEKIPIVQVFTVPEIIGGKGSVEREATKEEKEMFYDWKRDQEKITLAEKNLLLNINPETGETYSRKEISRRTRKEERKATTEKIKGYEIYNREEISQSISSGLQRGIVTRKDGTPVYGLNKKSADFIAGFTTGVLPSTAGEFGKFVITGGIAYGVGAGVRGVTYGLKQIPKYGRQVATTFQLGTMGAGVGLAGYYGTKKVEEYIMASPGM